MDEITLEQMPPQMLMLIAQETANATLWTWPVILNSIGAVLAILMSSYGLLQNAKPIRVSATFDRYGDTANLRVRITNRTNRSITILRITLFPDGEAKDFLAEPVSLAADSVKDVEIDDFYSWFGSETVLVDVSRGWPRSHQVKLPHRRRAVFQRAKAIQKVIEKSGGQYRYFVESEQEYFGIPGKFGIDVSPWWLAIDGRADIGKSTLNRTGHAADIEAIRQHLLSKHPDLIEHFDHFGDTELRWTSAVQKQFGGGWPG